MDARRPARFDLEQAVAAWRQFHLHRRVFLPEDLDELERHLRDHTAYLIQHGRDEKTAFREAVHALGDLGGGESEYRKVYLGKLRRRHQLTDELFWRFSMLLNYLKIALRTLRRQKGYSFINVFGLAIGLTCCAFIALYVWHEISYDRFHENADRIYRLRVERYASGGEQEFTATASAPMAPAVVRDHPQVEAAVRISPRNYLIEHENQRYYEEHFFWADSSFFDVFSFKLLRGNPATVLTAPFSVVLTESMAEKYFGDTDPIGQTLTIEDRDLRVTGLAADPPSQSHFRFDFLGSFSTLEVLNESPSSSWNWWSLSYQTYLLVTPGTDLPALQAAIRALPSRYIPDEESDSGYRQFLYLQPLTDIHLHSHYLYELEPNGRIAYVYIFSAAALFILLIACINFMNLATARSTQRAREVGVRKVMGARKGQMIGQFLGESVVLAGMALLLTIVLLTALLPVFNQLAGTAFSRGVLLRLPVILGLLASTLGVGVLAGSYPAFVLSAFRPVEVLKGTATSPRRGIGLHQGLVVFQFAISVALIISVLVVSRQLRYMQTQNLGFQKVQMLVLNVRNNDAVNARSYRTLREEMEQVPGVIRAAFSSSVPGRRNYTNVISRQRGMTDDGQTMEIVGVDPHFAETYGLDVVAGRTFSDEMVTDTAAFFINEATVRALGWTVPEEAVGAELTRQFGDSRAVIGVVKDFHFQSLQQQIQPLVFQIQPGWFNYVTLRISTEDVPQTLDQVQARWRAFSPDRPLEYFFLDADYDRQYRSEEQVSRIMTVFTVLALFIACLGLFGLATFTAGQRTKEIGVRKVLGASVPGIVFLLSKRFALLVGIAFLFAAPVAYFGMGWWLRHFAYRIDISWPIFLIAGLAALGIALLTVSYQSIKAALADPVKSLRHE